jgi:hypothetical protein
MRYYAKKNSDNREAAIKRLLDKGMGDKIKKEMRPTS